ncbi:hypothetical protein EK21DRAFT_112867 [Setomelanomma holmii]|uniref:Uncharacterized protein n=1 Tax=Setomelanomma holmii TaxID=210430 RepID=A0A9P4H899_9PLEO|nr:hypothetical protein EK21DRAFT_112867 [Setomelanomma holmii]
MGSFATERELHNLHVVPLGKGTTGDSSRRRIFSLTKRQPDKTVDIGRNEVAVSMDAQGRVLQASTFHPVHGIVMVVPFDQFDNSRFYDAPYVREYRTRMLRCLDEDRAGFGLDFGRPDHPLTIEIVAADLVTFNFQINDFSITISVSVSDEGSILQRCKATNEGADSLFLPYALRLGVSLTRASYGQLTEGGPIPLPRSHNRLRKIDITTLSVYNKHLEAQLAVSLDINGAPHEFWDVKEQEVFDAPLDTAVHGRICVPAGKTAQFLTRFQLSPKKDNNEIPKRHPAAIWDVIDNRNSRWRRDNLTTTYVVSRNVDYILANCVIPVIGTLAAVITDHVALPLGWNRNNYWQIRLLLETLSNVNNLVNPQFVHNYEEQIRFAVRGHLLWVFTKAEWPYGYWHRSYLVNGKPKDPRIFQLDQQCYPLLELCNYFEHFPGEIRLVNEIIDTGVVHDVLALLESKRDEVAGLWPTDETHGDDAVLYLYHFSSHVLLWWTFTRLQEFSNCIDATDGLSRRLRILAHDLRGCAVRAFTFRRPQTKEKIFAYLTDRQGQHTFYHDANDIPTFFAREWGFVCTTDEVEVWRSTMEFGLSTANARGYSKAGPYSGLGSVHSPGAWNLGYFQELAYAELKNDVQAMWVAWTKLTAAMNWDGTFSEAVDPRQRSAPAKHGSAGLVR